MVSADFDFEQICSVLESVAKKHGSPSEEALAVELAAWALHFIHQTAQMDSFREFLENLKEERPGLRIEHTFANMQDAQAWLGRQAAKSVLGTYAKIGDATCLITMAPSKLEVMFAPSPPIETLKAIWEMDD